MTRILLVDDHQILREGIRKSFEDNGEEIVGEAENGEEAIALARSTMPDVILMDLSMPVLDGVSATRRICEEMPEARIVVLTMHDDVSKTHEAINAGAKAYLSKGSKFTDVLATVRSVAAGDQGLSPELAESMLRAAEAARKEEALLSDRQTEILQSIANGRSTKQVARDLGITQKTVHNHLNAIYRRLDTQSLTHAVISAVKLGIIELQ
jgi:DNA-binding NarL/FixJ family response regulator